MRRYISSLPLLTLTAVLVLIGCSGPDKSRTTGEDPASRVVAVRLPEGAFPRLLTVADDGSVWCSESSGESIAHIARDGTVSHVRIPGTSNSPADVVQSPDGVIWFSGFELIGKIGTDGQLSGWRTELNGSPQIGLPNALTLGPDKAIWYTNKKSPPTITRISTTDEFTHFPIPTEGTESELGGITAGPDGAMWFTEENRMTGDAIGRMTVSGQYTRFRVSGREPGPGRIIAGPDAALWFTTHAGHIGRITVDGVISEFPLPTGTHPFDITSGVDGALWFTTDQRSLGRITTFGQITLHPVEGAKRLTGIAAAPDGSHWLADGEADTIWHYMPHQ